MKRRSQIALILLPLMIAACDKGAPNDGALADAAAKAASVPCALDGSSSFKTECTVERMVSGNDLNLIIHHPDGGFRRLLVATDGRGVTTADGSDQATVAVIDPGTIEVSIGGDRYRLPATVKGQTLPAR